MKDFVEAAAHATAAGRGARRARRALGLPWTSPAFVTGAVVLPVAVTLAAVVSSVGAAAGASASVEPSAALSARASAALSAHALAPPSSRASSAASAPASAAASPGQAGTPTNLSASTEPSSNPAIAATQSEVMVVWEEDEALAYSVRRGNAWTRAAPVPSAVGGQPSLAAVRGGGFQLAFSTFSEIDDNYEILFCAYSRGQWSLPEVVSDSSDDSIEPSLVVTADGQAYVSWTEVASDGVAVYAASRLPDGSWAQGPVPGAEGRAPALAVVSGGLGLAWLQDAATDGTSDVLFMWGAGEEWTMPEIVSDVSAAAAKGLSLDVDASGEPALTWLESDSAIRFSAWVGGRWTSSSSVHAAAPVSGLPSLAFAPGGPRVGWASDADVAVAQMSAGEWLPPESVFTFDGAAVGPALVGRSNELGLAVEGRPAGGPGDIYYIGLTIDDQPTTTPPTPTPTGVIPSATPTPVVTGALVYLPLCARH